jgi:hypothetical protein
MQYVSVVQTFTIRTFVSFVWYLSCKDIYRQYRVDFHAEPLSLEDI